MGLFPQRLAELPNHLQLGFPVKATFLSPHSQEVELTQPETKSPEEVT